MQIGPRDGESPGAPLQGRGSAEPRPADWQMLCGNTSSLPLLTDAYVAEAVDEALLAQRCRSLQSLSLPLPWDTSDDVSLGSVKTTSLPGRRTRWSSGFDATPAEKALLYRAASTPPESPFSRSLDRLLGSDHEEEQCLKQYFQRLHRSRSAPLGALGTVTA